MESFAAKSLIMRITLSPHQSKPQNTNHKQSQNKTK